MIARSLDSSIVVERNGISTPGKCGCPPHHEAVGDQRKALGKMKDRVRQISGRQGGRRLPDVIEELRSYLMGWRNYFDLASTPQVFANLDHLTGPYPDSG
jgi:hypothetical protein